MEQISRCSVISKHRACDQDAAKKAATKTANLNSQLQAPGAESRVSLYTANCALREFHGKRN